MGVRVEHLRWWLAEAMKEEASAEKATGTEMGAETDPPEPSNCQKVVEII